MPKNEELKLEIIWLHHNVNNMWYNIIILKPFMMFYIDQQPSVYKIDNLYLETPLSSLM